MKKSAFIIILLGFISCNEVDFIDDTYPEKKSIELSMGKSMSITNKNIRELTDTELSESEIYELITNYAQHISVLDKARAANTLPAEFRVVNKHHVTQNTINEKKSYQDISPQLIVSEVEFTYKGQKGRAFVSTNANYPKVLAYLPSYDEELKDDTITTKIMLQIAEQGLLAELNHKPLFPDSLSLIREKIFSDETILLTDELKSEDVRKGNTPPRTSPSTRSLIIPSAL